MIVKQLDSENYNSYNYKLTVEDNIQNIISSSDLPKVPFLCQSQFPYLIDFYKRKYVKQNQAKKEYENPFKR